nr:glycosyl transferase family 1 [Pseudomonas sp.]
MKLLFVHQNFPGQFRHVAPYLAQRGHQVVALGQGDAVSLPGVRVVSYRLARGNSSDVHPLAREFETKVLRADACAEAAVALKAEGFEPDVIVAHPGWGEAM